MSEAPGTSSRDVVSFDNTAGASDLVLNAGTVYSLAQFGSPTSSANSGNVGTGTIGGLAIIPGATIVGAYLVSLLSPTTFSVIAPDGRMLANGRVGTAYSDGITFALSAGGTAFAAGDGFTITAPAGSGLAVAYSGALPAMGITFNRTVVPAGATKVVTAIVREAEVNAGELVWAPGLTTMQQAAGIAQLKQQLIVARA